MSEQPAPITPPPGIYRLAPVPSEHVGKSRSLILAAADAVEPRRAIVLGAGNCAEIPLAELAARFAAVVVNDVDAKLLDEGLASAALDEAAAVSIRRHVADLTGATEPLVATLAAALQSADDVDAAIETMARIVDAAPVPGAGLADTFELVVASCVLSQLHFALVHRAGELFENRFTGQVGRLRSNPRWVQSLYDMARRMEHRFIDDLAALAAPGGLIYLSESAQMCYIQLSADGMWETQGTYRMLASQDITDYVTGRFTIVARGRWHWVVTPPTVPGDVGRLFDVQAVVLKKGIC